jgi:hypothetical protein
VGEETWEPLENVSDTKALDEYERRHGPSWTAETHFSHHPRIFPIDVCGGGEYASDRSAIDITC